MRQPFVTIVIGVMVGIPAIAVAQSAPKLFDRSRLSSNSAAIQRTIKSADLVFAGRVKAIGPAPRFWSGWAPARQAVTYEIDHIISGEYSGARANLGRPAI